MTELHCPKCGFKFTVDTLPIGEEKSLSKTAKEVVEAKKKSILEDYVGEEPEIEAKGVKKAVGKLSDYRERFKEKKISTRELIAPPSARQDLVRTDGELDKFNYKGDRLFFGEGISEDI